MSDREFYDRTGFLVDLNTGLVAVDSNDFADEIIVTDFDLSRSMHASAIKFAKAIARPTYQFVHGNTNHVLGHNDGTRAKVSIRTIESVQLLYWWHIADAGSLTNPEME